MKGSLGQRFWAKVDKGPHPKGCWLWIGARKGHGYKDGGGYGCFDKKRAHRVAWEMGHGPIVDGLFVLHSCDTPLCVNPAHLSLGSHAENMSDRSRGGRTVSPFGRINRERAARRALAEVAP